MDSNMDRTAGIKELNSLAKEKGNGLYLTLTIGAEVSAGINILIIDNEVEYEIETSVRSAIREIDNILDERPLLPVYGFTAAWCTFLQEWIDNKHYLKNIVWPGLTYIVTPVEEQSIN